MRRILVGLLAVGLTGCALGMGAPDDVALSTVALRISPGAEATEALAALRDVDARVALVAAPVDSAWLAWLAQAAGLHLSGPARAGDLSLAFLAGEALGDTAIDLTYDGGTFTVQDALYELAENHYLDLMAFRVDAGDPIPPIITSLLRYVATDVDPTAAVVFAVAVPNAAVGDSVARLLGPGYFDAFRCAGGDRPAEVAAGIRLFYGPERRIRCGDAAGSVVPGGLRVHADLVAGWQ